MADQEIGDPWSDPLSELERMQQEVEESELAHVDRESASINYDALWKDVQADSRTDFAVLSLGAELSRRGYDSWIPLWLLILRRDHEARRRTSVSDEGLRLITVLNLLRAACQGDRDSVRTDLNRAHSVAVPFVWSSTFTEARNWITLWGNSRQYPATPLMTRQELIAATAGGIVPGLSKANLSRDISKNRRIIIYEQVRGMARFQHVDAERQLAILKATVQFFDPS
jgi:hypothetical protein